LRSKNIESPRLFITKLDELSLSGKALIEIMQAVLSKGMSLRFRARGRGMEPFIKDGDVITLTPLHNSIPGVGEVVAFIRPQEENLIVHSEIAKNNGIIYVLGDNSKDN
jgi:hypothetical protein